MQTQSNMLDSSPKWIDENSPIAKLVVFHFGQNIASGHECVVTGKEAKEATESFNSEDGIEFGTFMIWGLFVPVWDMRFEPLTVTISKSNDEYAPSLYRIDADNVRYTSGDPYCVMVNPNGCFELAERQKGSVKVISKDTHGIEVWNALLRAQFEAKALISKSEGNGNLPQHITFNPATKSYYKYKAVLNEGTSPTETPEPITFIDIEINPNSSKILRGWTLEELESIVKHLKEQTNEHM